MRRRGVLSTVGVIALGGCAGLDNIARKVASDGSTPIEERQPLNEDVLRDADDSTDAAEDDGLSDFFKDQAAIEVTDEEFNPLSLTLDVTLEARLADDPITIERHSGGSVKERYRITDTGARTLRDLTQGDVLRSESTTLFSHLVGAECFAVEPRAGFEGLSYASIPLKSGETYDRRFEYDVDAGWFDRGHVFTMSIPKAAYEYCTARPRIPSAYGFYAADPVNTEFAAILAGELEANFGEDSRKAIDAAIGFVQSLAYTDDSVTAGYDEYQRYPIETLVDRGGDCEDTAILLGNVIREMGVGVKGILLPGHMALGVKGADDIPGTYYEVDGDRYYYVETTGDGWQLGEMPDAQRNEGARLVDMVGYPVVNYSLRTAESMTTAPTFLYQVQNDGDATAHEVTVRAMLRTDSGALDIANGSTATVHSLRPGESKLVPITLLSPSEPLLRLHTQVTVDGQLQIDDQPGDILL